ncbi:hypothetical protein [Pseudomonas gingeri]
MQTGQELQFINSTSSRMLLVLEPRSSEFWIERGATVTVLVRDPSSVRSLDVEYLVGGLVVYTRPGDQIEVYKNGLRLPHDKRTRRMAGKLTS